MGKRYVAWILTGRGLLRCRQSPVEQLAYFLKQLNTRATATARCWIG